MLRLSDWLAEMRPSGGIRRTAIVSEVLCGLALNQQRQGMYEHRPGPHDQRGRTVRCAWLPIQRSVQFNKPKDRESLSSFLANKEVEGHMADEAMLARTSLMAIGNWT